ncbi:MAG: GNAT family N-acetyltransferase, partial [candidate division Zixibacteria bacterium]|nr:GNAT family N-acetyltransferase [candidate division Zixibacteria bacterium]
RTVVDLDYRTDYWDDAELKQEFQRYLIDIFGLDLSLWDKMGFWDRKYRPFTYFKDGRLISSVNVYSMNMRVRGRDCRVAQISAVGTQPEYRLRGLNRQLTEKAMAWAADTHDFFFLFANVEAWPFYKKCGFRQVEEHKAVIEVTGRPPRGNVRKLDINQSDDRELIFRIASGREPVSDLLGVTNTRLFMFWCLYFLKDGIYYLPDLDTLVLAERKDDVLSVCDVVATQIPSFAEFYPYLAAPGDKSAEFLFMADKMQLGDRAATAPAEDNGTHLYGTFPFDGEEFILPLTCHA